MNIQSYTISRKGILEVLDRLIAGGIEVHAPLRIGSETFFRPVNDAGEIDFQQTPTTESPKALLFPKVQRLLSFTKTADGVAVVDHAREAAKDRIVFGTHPCDAIALDRLAGFFCSDCGDEYMAQRRKGLTVISISCATADQDCFCTGTGSHPGDTKGSDVLLTPIGDDCHYVECLTDRGAAFVAGGGASFVKSEQLEKEKYLAKVDASFSSGDVASRLAGAFDDPMWSDASLRCLGCGACAFVCPVCSCFDIQDEGSAASGERLRCWDSCGFALFTLHTSGHNPRPTQVQRWRQRIMHKFSYSPEQLGYAGCVGCGRCSRACPADMNLKEQLAGIAASVPVRK